MPKKHETEINRAVRRWSAAMCEKLRANRHKGGWANMTVPELLRRIHEEVGELVEAVTDDEREHVIRNEAVDVANMAMMLFDVVAVHEWVHPYGYDSHGNPEADQRGEDADG